MCSLHIIVLVAKLYKFYKLLQMVSVNTCSYGKCVNEVNVHYVSQKQITAINMTTSPIHNTFTIYFC